MSMAGAGKVSDSNDEYMGTPVRLILIAITIILILVLLISAIIIVTTQGTRGTEGRSHFGPAPAGPQAGKRCRPRRRLAAGALAACVAVNAGIAELKGQQTLVEESIARLRSSLEETQVTLKVQKREQELKQRQQQLLADSAAGWIHGRDAAVSYL